MKSVIKVSKMSGKLEGFRAINFSPLESSFCQSMSKIDGSICQSCYSVKMCKSYRKKAEPVWAKNAQLLRQELEDNELPRFKEGEYVRFLGHGDMDDIQQMRNFCRIAELNENTYFSMWTKNTALVYEAQIHGWIPKNLKVIQSSIFVGIDAELEDHFFSAVFTVFNSKGEIPEGHHLCHGQKCRDCMFCYSKPRGYIGEVLR